MKLPEIVTEDERKQALERIRAKEKEQTRARDDLAAERRRLPMVRIEKSYALEGPKGRASLIDLFEGPPAAPPLPFHVRPQSRGRM